MSYVTSIISMGALTSVNTLCCSAFHLLQSVHISAWVFLYGVCMLSWCMCAFPLATPTPLPHCACMGFCPVCPYVVAAFDWHFDGDDNLDTMSSHVSTAVKCFLNLCKTALQAGKKKRNFFYSNIKSSNFPQALNFYWSFKIKK